MARRRSGEDTVTYDQLEPASEQPRSAASSDMGLLSGACEGRGSASCAQLRHLYRVGACETDVARPTIGCMCVPALQSRAQRIVCTSQTGGRAWSSYPSSVVALSGGTCARVHAIT